MDKERREHYRKIYDIHLVNKYISVTYNTAKIQAGWKTKNTQVSFLVDGKRVTAPQDLANIKMETFNNKNQNPLQAVDPLSKLSARWGNRMRTADDGLDNMINKHGAEILHGPITQLINSSIRQEKFTARWKISKILPLHKGKGLDVENPTSYRPISLLPILGKITECALQRQILNFMKLPNNIMKTTTPTESSLHHNSNATTK